MCSVQSLSWLPPGSPEVSRVSVLGCGHKREGGAEHGEGKDLSDPAGGLMSPAVTGWGRGGSYSALGYRNP
jgi:hypothetical protein